MINSVNGIMLIDKPEGRTSSSVIQHIKKSLKIEKVGHAGTLDPFATGLLIVMCGKSTKLSDYLLKGKKSYSGIIKLGLVTTSDDVTGEVVSESKKIPKFEEIKELVKKEYIGEIQQIPPQVSAKQIDGVRAYVSARKGEKVDLKPCSVSIYSFEIVPGKNLDEIKFNVSCSAGTYIRALARDIGEHFGCGGCLMSLRRTESSGFLVEQANTIDKVGIKDILAWDVAFPDYPRIYITSEILELLRKGDERVLPRINSNLTHICSDKVVLLDEESHTPGALMSRGENGWNRAFVC